MPLSFHTRLTDAQVAAIDAAATFTDPRTGLRLSVSRQEVVSSVLDQWMALHATPAPGRADADAGVTVEGAPAVREETVQALADSAGLPAPGAEALTPETPPMPAEVPVVVSTMPEEPEPSGADRRHEELSTLRAVALQAMADQPEPDAEALTPETPPVPTPATSPRKPKATAKRAGKAKKKRPSSAMLDMQVLAQVQTLGPCSCAAVQKALGVANSTIYGSLARLVQQRMLTKDGELYQVHARGLQEA